MIKMEDIADKAGVSRKTVYKALYDLPGVSVNTAKKVKKIAEELGYMVSMTGKSLVTGKTNIIGVILPILSGTVYSEILSNLEHYARLNKYNIIICESRFDADIEREYVDMLISRRVDGVIALPYYLYAKDDDYKNIKKLMEYKIPVVLIEQPIKIGNVKSFIADNEDAIENIVDFLYSKGRRRIAFFGYRTEKDETVSIFRINGYKNGIKKYNLKEFVYDTLSPVDGSKYNIEEDIYDFIDKNDLDAIICIEDRVAEYMLYIAKKYNINIPSKLSITGFDNREFTNYLIPSLSTVKQPVSEMAKGSIEYLLSVIENNPLNIDEQFVKYPCEFIIRDSTD